MSHMEARETHNDIEKVIDVGETIVKRHKFEIPYLERVIQDSAWAVIEAECSQILIPTPGSYNDR